ncbi:MULTISPECIES: O-antigen translocase [unclassified Pseudomonas]|uniref:O-antigen translocase n=1 Tax=unclassified Pseudomonas TaxID=196821 RepID=UPI000BDA2996|nr:MULTISPECIES: O-antigen translocase [unclassified Pseudomonas]PVZ16455.1 PST family polysaccharide transporter [Pseudomonas sp. URIL14HWK12:I12]PVZ25689.1 PST family polysaccharide transporter [Pseudomonas sp. URIL14HWK12:I10]PVZ36787.1 PST family polysaccharide transporter [Pseudomonas sp. URIL14HWK12:I11]SNZ12614.1 polysaccharide transporter, PST family [Pseudomonas sp. URIL14HWK12:I9]
MKLLRTSFLNALAVSVKMLAMLGINKVLAVYLGPAGYAAIGQFQNAVQIINNFCTLAAGPGVTKYTAQYHAEPAKQRSLWQTAGMLTILLSLVVSVSFFLLKDKAAILFFGNAAYADVCVWLSVSIVFSALNFFILAILNGRKDIGLYVTANIGGSVFSVLMVVLLVVFFHLRGALIALATYQAVSFLFSVWLVRRRPWFGSYLFWGRPNRAMLRNLGKFAAMGLVSALCLPLSQFAVRSYIGNSLGWEAAGNWEAMWRLSSAYLLLATTTLAVYFLPRFSELGSTSMLRAELVMGFKYIVPICVIGAIGIFFFRDFIIALLFSGGFQSVRDLFAWQLFGDVVKVSGFILGYLLQARAFWKFFIVSEVAVSTSFYLFSILFLNMYGLVGAVIGYALAYCVYFLMISFFLWRKRLFSTALEG